MNRVAVFGSSNIDLVLGVDEMPKPGETVRSSSFNLIPGGKGANQACACGKLGGNCVFLSSIGDDENGKVLLESLTNANVDCTNILVSGDYPTGMAIIPVDSHGENSIIVVSGANALCDNKYYVSVEKSVLSAKVLLCQLETAVDTVYRAITAAKAQGVLTILNPAPAVRNIPDEVYRSLDYITPNETELEILTGISTETEENIPKAAQILLDRGVKNVVVTLGGKGALLVNASEETRYPAFKANAVDTTAAGDTFNAAMAMYLAEDESADKAIVFGNAAASISVSRKGAQTSIPTRAEVINMINEKENKK